MSNESPLQAVLRQLHKNLAILEERRAKYAGNEPLDLLHQIEDHQTAIDLTEQAINGDLSQADWQVALHPLLVNILEAARGVRDHQFSFWDAQIWAAAHLNQIPVVFSEDFSPGSVIEGVRFVNPFAEAFRVEAWV